ncbi:PEP-CTERM sorting domain-containing protein [Massilia sp. YIM B04103]|uniref:PEP-CTERM sorting domain-containing protein n=1 Tax=Massilia sp. YIM B04103 TaxID=2963106 RepID=UPI002109A68E|nr:PEP-CTERM sorting domain-containing protein [Massilia sp. YIM B04103]
MGLPSLLQILVATLIALTAGSSVATPIQVADVYNPYYPYGPVGNPYRGTSVGTLTNVFQQTYTAGKTGLLSGMAIYGERGAFGNYNNSLRIKIGNSSGWYSGPWDAELYAPLSGSIFDLTKYNLHINAGDLVTFELGNWDSVVYLVQHPLGALLKQYVPRSPSPTIYPPVAWNDWSVAFSTYVTTDPDVKPENPSTRIPEPSTISVMLLGMGLLACVRHRNRRQKS